MTCSKYTSTMNNDPVTGHVSPLFPLNKTGLQFHQTEICSFSFSSFRVKQGATWQVNVCDTKLFYMESK